MLFCLGLMRVSLPSAFSPWCLEGGASGRQLGWGEPALLLGAERGDVQYHHPEIALCFLHSPHGAL